MRISLQLMHICILPWQRRTSQLPLACPLLLKHRIRKGGWHDKEALSSLRALAGVLLLSLVLAGCASPPIAGPGGDADYRHPKTGDVQHCDNHTTAGFLLFGVIGAVVSGNNYADCKNDLEEKGYVRARGTTQLLQPAAIPAPLVAPPPASPVDLTNERISPANPQVDLSQAWILGTWGTFEGRSGSIDGVAHFEFRQDGREFRWRMVRTGWFSGVQTTQTASGSVTRISESTVELKGKYESSNLGNMVGTPVQQSFTRDGNSLRGWEAARDGTQSLLSLTREQ